MGLKDKVQDIVVACMEALDSEVFTAKVNPSAVDSLQLLLHF